MLARQGRDMSVQITSIHTVLQACKDQHLLCTAIEQYIKLESKRPKYDVDVGGTAISSETVVHPTSNKLFACGNKEQVGPLEKFITTYKKAPFIEDTSTGDDSAPNYNLTGFRGVTKDQQENYVRGMIYNSAEWFMNYQNKKDEYRSAQTDETGKEKEKLLRCFRKLFQSLNLLRVQYDLKATEPNTEEKNNLSNKRRRAQKISPPTDQVVQERITESLSALFDKTLFPRSNPAK